MLKKEVRNVYFDDYMLKAMQEFEEGWTIYEKRLQKYLLNYEKFTDWQQVKLNSDYNSGSKSSNSGTSGGLTPSEYAAFAGNAFYWFNSKTGEKTLEHPGKKLFKMNRKAMRKRAEEKFRLEFVERIEQEQKNMTQLIKKST